MIKKSDESLLINRERRFDSFIFWACALDLLFLPYVWFVNIPYTLPLLLCWTIINKKKLFVKKEFILFLTMLMIMCLSTFLGYLVKPSYISDSIILLIQFMFIFLYYFLFSNYAEKYYFNIKNILILFLTFVFILAIIYNINKFLYHDIKLFWNLRSGSVINTNLYRNFEGYRFSFIYMDPNNIGYLMNSVVLYLWCNEKTSLFTKIYCLIALIIILISAMSNGAFIAFGISIVSYLFIHIISIDKIKIKKKIKILDILLLGLSPFIIGSIIKYASIFLNSAIVKESLNRVESNSGESRLVIWKRLIENVDFKDFIFFGRGGVTLVNNLKFNSHNGHFYWILSYGFVAYLIFIFILFRKKKTTPLKNYIWIISFFIGFSINILIGETKLMGVFVLLIACSRSTMYLKNNKEGTK